MASTVTTGQTVSASYTRVATPLLEARGYIALSMVGRAVSVEALKVSRAVIGSDGRSVTIQLSEKNLKGDPAHTSCSYAVDGVNMGSPESAESDAEAGTVELVLSSTEQVTIDQNVTVNYRQAGSLASRIQDHADERFVDPGNAEKNFMQLFAATVSVIPCC